MAEVTIYAVFRWDESDGVDDKPSAYFSTEEKAREFGRILPKNGRSYLIRPIEVDDYRDRPVYNIHVSLDGTETVLPETSRYQAEFPPFHHAEGNIATGVTASSSENLTDARRVAKSYIDVILKSIDESAPRERVSPLKNLKLVAPKARKRWPK